MKSRNQFSRKWREPHRWIGGSIPIKAKKVAGAVSYEIVRLEQIGGVAPQSTPFLGKANRPESDRLFQIRRQHIFDPFHERANSARQIAPMRYDQRHNDRPAAKIGHDLNKRTTL
jgi:hypothetical protein